MLRSATGRVWSFAALARHLLVRCLARRPRWEPQSNAVRKPRLSFEPLSFEPRVLTTEALGTLGAPILFGGLVGKLPKFEPIASVDLGAADARELSDWAVAADPLSVGALVDPDESERPSTPPPQFPSESPPRKSKFDDEEDNEGYSPPGWWSVAVDLDLHVEGGDEENSPFSSLFVGPYQPTPVDDVNGDGLAINPPSTSPPFEFGSSTNGEPAPIPESLPAAEGGPLDDVQPSEPLPAESDGPAPNPWQDNGSPLDPFVPSERDQRDNEIRARFFDNSADRPLRFEPNLGQTAESVSYSVAGTGFGIVIDGSDIVINLSVADPLASHPSDTGAPNESQTGKTVALRMSLIGANPSASAIGSELLPSKSHYFTGNDPAHWQTDVSNFRKVSVADVYPGIDLVLRGNDSGKLEYDFEVSAGADPSQIAFAFDGADAISLSSSNELEISIGDAKVIHRAPVLFQQDAEGNRQAISGQFTLDANGEVSFITGAYDASRPLTIDPVIDFSGTVLPLGAVETAGLDVDSYGNAYAAVVGTGSASSIVVKLDPLGNVVYSTTVAGNAQTRPRGIAIDEIGNAYVVGETNSSTYPTVSPFQPTYAGDFDGFVYKLNPAGSLTFSSFLGGLRADAANAVAVDGSSNIFIAGYTNGSAIPPYFPIANAFQPISTDGDFVPDAFVTKISAGGTIDFSTYLGGLQQDFANAITVDSDGNSYIVGDTYSTNFPVLNAYQAVKSAGQDAFVAKFSPSGSLDYSSFLGGGGAEVARTIAVDADGGWYVGGYTNSLNFPILNAARPTFGGMTDGFVTKLGANGSTLVYSTFFGGTSNDRVDSLALSPRGTVLLTGTTGSIMMTTPDA